MADRSERTVRMAGPGQPPATIASAGLVALAVAIGIGRFAFTPILPIMQQDAGLRVTAGGCLLTCLLLAASAYVLSRPVRVQTSPDEGEINRRHG